MDPINVVAGISGIIMALGVATIAIWGIASLVLYGTGPHRTRKGIIAALEESERIGVSDGSHEIKRLVKRWRLLNLGFKKLNKYELEDYADRIEAQLRILNPYVAVLERRMLKLSRSNKIRVDT